MRRSGLIIAEFPDVCIFCASRWKAPRPLPQRRFFKSGHIVHRPPNTATAQVPEETKIDVPIGPGAFPQKAGGWAQKNFMPELGLKKSASPDSSPSDSLAPKGQGTTQTLTVPKTKYGLKGSHELGATGKIYRGEKLVRKHVASQYHPPEVAKPSQFGQQKWQCHSCGHMNPAGTHCESCASYNFTYHVGKQDRDPSRQWEHLKFNRPATAKASKNSIDPEATSSPEAERQVDRSREGRLARTKDGRFVGFTKSGNPSQDPPGCTSSKSVSSMDRERQPRPDGRKISRSAPDDAMISRSAPDDVMISRSQSGRHGRIASAQYVRGNNRERERKRSKFVSAFANEEEEDDMADKIEEKRQRKREKAARKLAAPPTPIILPEYISVANLAIALRVPIEGFAVKMRELGFEEINHDHILDAETAGLIASEFNYEPTTVAHHESYDICARPPVEDTSLLPPRPPVVTIMGHVDHGKTTLLDWLRNSSVAASEHGGITQHIGAFSVSMPSGRLITFLDTPGHAAFLDMRQRGANVTDIVILVVAADDSVKPQTVEALKHAQAAKVPIIVAVNKVDKADANVDRVKKDLARYGVEIEEYGGDTQVVPVSGKTGQGMVELEEAVIALADLLDMRAETDGAAEGWVLEATKRKAGRVATVLVSRGTIRPGDVIVAGCTWARARTLRDASGAPVLAAGPGTPVEIDGWREQPKAGDGVLQAESEQQAKSAIGYRIEVGERDQMATDMAALNETRRAEQQKREQEEQDEIRRKAGEEIELAPAKSPPGIQDVFFIIKADVSGSVEAVLNSVSALGNSEVRPHILRSAVGPVTEFDIDHAATAKGHIISFNTVIEPSIARMADQAGVQIIDQSIIYRLVDEVKAKLSAYLAPIITQRVLGEAEIAQIFEISFKQRGQVPIAGCKIRNGIVTRRGKVRVMRGQEIIYNGTLSSLKNVKKDVTEMHKGTECGIGFENWTAFEVGDLVQSYEDKIEQRSL